MRIRPCTLAFTLFTALAPTQTPPTVMARLAGFAEGTQRTYRVATADGPAAPAVHDEIATDEGRFVLPDGSWVHPVRRERLGDASQPATFETWRIDAHDCIA